MPQMLVNLVDSLLPSPCCPFEDSRYISIFPSFRNLARLIFEKILWRIGASWAAYVFRNHGGMPSGPCALDGLNLFS